MWHGNVGWGDWLVMTLGMLVFWGLAIWGVVYFMRSGPRAGGMARTSPEGILAERLARGEVELSDYHQRLEALSSQGSRRTEADVLSPSEGSRAGGVDGSERSPS